MEYKVKHCKMNTWDFVSCFMYALLPVRHVTPFARISYVFFRLMVHKRKEVKKKIEWIRKRNGWYEQKKKKKKKTKNRKQKRTFDVSFGNIEILARRTYRDKCRLQ